jgi:hypothetical protein
MCATKSPPIRVRWGGLYAVMLSAFAVTAAIGIVSLPALWRVGATVVVFVAGAMGMLRCLAMQRVALDLSDWCDCAKSTVAVRIVALYGLPRGKATGTRGVRRRVLGTTLGK